MRFAYHVAERFQIVLLSCHEQTVAPQRCDCNRLLFSSNASLGHYQLLPFTETGKRRCKAELSRNHLRGNQSQEALCDTTCPPTGLPGNFTSRRPRTTSAIQFPVPHNFMLPVIQAQSRRHAMISAVIFGSDSGPGGVMRRGRSGKEDRPAPRHWRGCEIPRLARRAGPQHHR